MIRILTNARFSAPLTWLDYYDRLHQRNNILIAHQTTQNLPYTLECSLVLGQWMPQDKLQKIDLPPRDLRLEVYPKELPLIY